MIGGMLTSLPAEKGKSPEERTRERFFSSEGKIMKHCSTISCRRAELESAQQCEREREDLKSSLS